MDDGARLVLRFALQSEARSLMSRERVAWCLRSLAPRPTGGKFSVVNVMYSERVHRAHYKNLMVCGSVWMCPVCSAKISERRRVELAGAVEKNSNLQIALGTFTLRHNIEDDLKTLVDAELQALRLARGCRAWQEFERRFGLLGTVRAHEVTYGESGWHPHSHALFFFKRDACLDGARDLLKEFWCDALHRCDRDATWARGFDWRDARSDVADYVAKWGHEPKKLERPGKWSMEHELVKSASKISRVRGGSSMLQLLSSSMSGDKIAGGLWKEYARVFKGKKQLVWSRGLRARLGLDVELSDEELAKREDETAILLASIPKRLWKVILKKEMRAQVLNVASSGDVEALHQFLHLIEG